MPPTEPTGRKRRSRDETVAAILRIARDHLAQTPPDALSFRAIARELDLVSSAVYRYFPSRDALLTALLVEVYDELGVHVEAADAAVQDRSRTAKRLAAFTHAIRDWSLAHPNDYALIYGTPVQGYAAPEDTVTPAQRVTTTLVRIVADSWRGRAVPAGETTGTTLRAIVEPVDVFVEDATGTSLPGEVTMRTLMAWTTIFGTVSFELWGHYPAELPTSAYMDALIDRLARDLGLS
ncbi:TetR/AcrR family transcriptional regulator [Mumia zhuanghuii]|uniref:TetR/AcrR family transcriptional regulator n=1 Tax=Mumia zhuanghuii TaxID=2585211 RepID=UPI0036336057